MAAPSAGTKIVLQVGEELRIRNNGDLIVDNPELELAREERAADRTRRLGFRLSDAVEFLPADAQLRGLSSGYSSKHQ